MKTLFRNLILPGSTTSAPVNIFGVRIVGASSVTASVTATILGVAVVFRAAYRNQLDPGTWGNNLSVNFYGYDFRMKGNFVLDILYNGKVVESFYAPTCALLQQSVNQSSGYVSVTFPAEISTNPTTALTGTLTTTTNSNIVTGTGTAFTTELKIGSLVYTTSQGNVTVGRVKSITNDTSAVLATNALVAVTGTQAYKRNDVTSNAALTGGTYVAPVETDFYPVSDPVAPIGLAILDAQPVNIVAVSENHTLTMAVALRDYCLNLANRIPIIQIPLNASEAIVENFANALQSNQRSWACAYLDWVNIKNDSGDLITIPGLGVIIGAGFIRSPYVQGNSVHIPPAGTDSVYQGIDSVIAPNLSQTQVNKYVREYTVNVSGFFEGYGRYLISSRMMSTNELYMSIHTELQTNFYVRVLQLNMQYVAQKPNTPELKKDALVRLQSYFNNEYEKGALERSVPFERAYNAVSDLTNNPLSQNRKQLNIDINYIPTECSEAVKVSLNRNDASLTTKVN